MTHVMPSIQVSCITTIFIADEFTLHLWAPHMSVYYPYMHFSKQRVRSPAPVNNVVLQPSCSIKALIIAVMVVLIDTIRCCVRGITRQA